MSKSTDTDDAANGPEWEEAGQLWHEVLQRFGESRAGVIMTRMYLDAEKEADSASRGFGRLKPNAD